MEYGLADGTEPRQDCRDRAYMATRRATWPPRGQSSACWSMCGVRARHDGSYAATVGRVPCGVQAHWRGFWQVAACREVVPVLHRY
jgi:hypothetical protein